MVRAPIRSMRRLGVPSNERLSHSPLLVFYEVTRACDLLCLHCRACAQRKPDPRELSEEQGRQLIDQLCDFPSPPMLVITGGDPFKRKDLFTLIEYARKSGLEVSVTPSATPLVTREAIGRLKEAEISRLAISIDGADASTHDAFRGVSGSFERSTQILADANAAGIATQVNTTVTPANIDQLDQMADFFAELGISMWSLFFLVPVGRAQGTARLTAQECEAVFERLWRQSHRQPYAIKTTEAPHYRRFVINRRRSESPHQSDSSSSSSRWLGLNDGKGVMFVSHRGSVYPSGFLAIECGRFPQDRIVPIYQESPLFRALRDANRLEGKCARCEFRSTCGGSRARAYAVTGNPFAEEPDCAYEPIERVLN